jgi:hypothetical protein
LLHKAAHSFYRTIKSPRAKNQSFDILEACNNKDYRLKTALPMSEERAEFLFERLPEFVRGRGMRARAP